MPQDLLNCYITMIPVVKAMESLRRVIEMQVASGAMENASEIWNKWQELVDTYAPQADEKKFPYPSEDHFKVHMMALGARVVSSNGSGEKVNGNGEKTNG